MASAAPAPRPYTKYEYIHIFDNDSLDRDYTLEQLTLQINNQFVNFFILNIDDYEDNQTGEIGNFWETYTLEKGPGGRLRYKVQQYKLRNDEFIVYGTPGYIAAPEILYTLYKMYTPDQYRKRIPHADYGPSGGRRQKSKRKSKRSKKSKKRSKKVY